MPLPSELLGDIANRSKQEGAAASSRLRTVPESCRNDRSAANVALLQKQQKTLDKNDDDATREYFFSSGVETWIDSLRKYTFTSSFCSLPPEEAAIIVNHWEAQSAKMNGDDESFDLKLLRETKLKLKDLHKRLSGIIDAEKAKSPSGCAFVKLSTRSPKDSRKVLAIAAESYRGRIADLHTHDDCNEGMGAGNIDSNTRWKILSEEVAKKSAVENAADALDILLDSFRIYEDLKYALEGWTSSCGGKESCGEENKKWNVSLVARAWDPRVRPEKEFRGICWNGKLTCLSQYFHPLYFEEIVKDKDGIGNDILTCFADPSVQTAVQSLAGHCIIDFARVSPGQVLIIELNPFDGVGLGTFPASTGLFLWDNEGDKKIMKGEAPFEFRVRESPAPEHKLKNDCNRAWRAIVYGK